MKGLTEELVSDGVLKTPRLIEAFLHIDRADFVPKDEKEHAYRNTPLPIGYGQTISQPWTVAFMLELLLPMPGEKILDIGSGSGWQTALLAHIVSHDDFGNELPKEKCGHIVGIELVPELAQLGRKNIFSYNFIKKGIVEIHCLNAEGGFPQGAPYDKIIAAAAGEKVPEAWKNELKNGGVIVAPIKSKIVQLLKEGDNVFAKDEFEGFAFVPFIENDDENS